MVNLAGSNINQSLNTLENFVGKFVLWRRLFQKHLDYDNDSVSVYLVKNNPDLVITSLFQRFNGERKTNYDNVNKLSTVVENDCFNAYVIGRNVKSLTNLNPKLKHTPVHYNDMATVYNEYVKKLNDFVNESTNSIVYTSKSNVKHTVSIDKLIEQLNVLIQADECNAYGREILTRYKTDLTKFLPRGFYDNSSVLPITVLDDYDADDDSSTNISSLQTVSTYTRSSVSTYSSSSEASVEEKGVSQFPRECDKSVKIQNGNLDLDSVEDNMMYSYSFCNTDNFRRFQFVGINVRLAGGRETDDSREPLIIEELNEDDDGSLEDKVLDNEEGNLEGLKKEGINDDDMEGISDDKVDKIEGEEKGNEGNQEVCLDDDDDDDDDEIPRKRRKIEDSEPEKELVHQNDNIDNLEPKKEDEIEVKAENCELVHQNENCDELEPEIEVKAENCELVHKNDNIDDFESKKEPEIEVKVENCELVHQNANCDDLEHKIDENLETPKKDENCDLEKIDEK
ncbi:GSCOCG00009686001-RA-CDS [Cotesia congregata]|nr:GSCOCG00009686001-RA-CDS [Cotesia congregata]